MSENEVLGCKFGAQTLFALRHTGEICGSNGLPLTPKSIGILGKSQILKKLKHKNLAEYLDFIRGKHGLKLPSINVLIPGLFVNLLVFMIY